MPPAPQRGSLEGDLLSLVNDIPLVNTHEHIIPEAERVASHIDFFTLAGHYAISDVICQSSWSEMEGSSPISRRSCEM